MITKPYSLASLELVAEYFAAYKDDIVYADFHTDWEGYVGWIGEAGNILEELMEEARDRPGEDEVDWYYVLEECAGILHKALDDTKGRPDDDLLRARFADSIGRGTPRLPDELPRP